MSQLSEDSGFADDDESSSSSSSLNVCKLRKCGHMLHHPCLIMYIKNSSNVREKRERERGGGREREREGEGEEGREKDLPICPSKQGGFQCPTCKKSYGVKTGDMPNGQMSVRNLPSTHLPGHERHGTIEITYNFRPGVYVS